MSLRSDLDRAKSALKRRERQRQNILIATVQDVSMREQYGFIVCSLIDGTPVNVMAWSTLNAAVGQQATISPLTEHGYDWWSLVGVNASTDVEATPYVMPETHPASIAYLDWSKIDTSASQVNLATQVSGVLPVGKQAKQTSLLTISQAIAASGTVSGSFAGCRLGQVRKLALTGGSSAVLRFRESAGGAVEYETDAVSTPFSDNAGWTHLSDGPFYYELENHGADATFTIAMQVIAWEL